MKLQHLLQRLEVHAHIRKDSYKNIPKHPQDKAKTVFLKDWRKGKDENRYFLCNEAITLITAEGYQESNSRIMKTKNK